MAEKVGCYYQLRQLRRLWQSLDSDSLATLVYAVMNSQIDYCNTVLAGAPRTVTDKLYSVCWTLLHASSPALGSLTTAAVWVRYCTMNFTGSTSPCVCDRVLFKLAVTVHRCLNGRAPPYRSVRLLRPGHQCWHSAASAFHQPSTTCSTSLYTGSTLTAVVPFQLPAPQSETLFPISSMDPTVSADCFKRCLRRICSFNTSTFSALEVLDDNCAMYCKSTYLFTLNCLFAITAKCL